MSERKSIRSGELKLGGLVMKVHILDDGTRIIEEESVINFLKYLEEGVVSIEDAEKFTKDLKTF